MDLICLTETNKYWSQVECENTIWGATTSWRENRIIQVSQNTFRPAESKYSVGGTAMMDFDDLVFRISPQGTDSRGLGRWSYITI